MQIFSVQARRVLAISGGGWFDKLNILGPLLNWKNPYHSGIAVPKLHDRRHEKLILKERERDRNGERKKD